MNKHIFGSLFDQSPLLAQAVGITPLLLFSTTLISGFVCGMCTFFVLLITSLCVSLLRKWIPRGAATLVFVSIGAGLSVLLYSVAELCYIDGAGAVLCMMPMLAFNTLFVNRASESYVHSNMKKNILFTLKNAAIFLLTVTVISAVRELAALGTIAGVRLFETEYGCTFFVLPAGGLFLLGVACGVYRFFRLKHGTEAQDK